VTTTVHEPHVAERPTLRLPGGRSGRFLYSAALAVLLLSISRVVTDANDLTSSGAFGAALRLGVPVLLAGLGGLYAERAGVVNIGLEGMMVLGAWFAGWVGYEFGGWWGLLFGILGGALGGLLHALATVTFGVDQIVSGVAINLIAPGVTRFLSAQFFTGKAGGSATSGPNVGRVGRFTFPFLSGGDLFGWKTPDMLGWFEDKGWFFVSDAAGIVRGLTVNLSMITLFAMLLVPISAFVLWRTPFGLRLRSIGEKPSAADSLGVRVNLIKYQALAISGGLAGMGGAFLVIEQSRRFQEGLTSGVGFIGLAALIFGNWRPWGVAAGAGLFGLAQALQLRSDDSVRALLLFGALALGLTGLYSLYVRKSGAFIVMAILTGTFLFCYITVKEVPREFTYMTPYITTLLVLVFASQRLRPPAAAGKPWRKGQS
jgi:general nucleoside transport system permease protein